MSANLEQVFTALRRIEQGHPGREVSSAMSDGGRTRGPYRIGRGNIEDVNRRFGTDYTWADADDPEKAEQIILLYWLIWCPEAVRTGDWETCARIHNGGPDGHLEAATLPYAAKFRAALNQGEEPMPDKRQQLRRTKLGQIPVTREGHLKLYEVVSPDTGFGTVTPATGELFERGRAILAARIGQEVPITVNSGARSVEYNASLPNSARNSYHLTGQALDLATPRGVPYPVFADVWDEANPEGGVILYPWGVHVDTRGERYREDRRG
ncbi:MAG: hypothetical protein GHCLOJNM_03054 [bacterium]|nr:hypothetical protein [bacterium]